METCCRRSVLPAIARMKPGERFIPPAATNLPSFSDSPKIDIISRMEPEFHFGRTRAREWIESPNWCARSVERIWKARKSAPITAPDIMDSFLKIRTGTNWKFAAGKIQSLRSERVQRRVGE